MNSTTPLFGTADLPPATFRPEVEDFANALDECLSPFLSPADRRERLLDLPRRYHENALRRLAKARPRRARESQVDIMDMDMDDGTSLRSSLPLDADEMRSLEEEIQTWDLVRRLFPLRHADSAAMSFDRDTIVNGSHRNNDAVHEFLLTDSLAQERRAVLQWLQNNAASGPDIDTLVEDLQKNADRGDIIAHGWLHTRSAIKLRKSMTGWPHLLDKQSPSIAQSHVSSAGAPLVTQLDPDAITRQGRKLEPQDEFFERAIWLGCFEHLRRGSDPEVIREWCQDRTELWRSISMSAMLLPTNDFDRSIDASPESLALWRRMCYGLAKHGGSDDYERAVYGILSGDISSVEKVSESWDDFLFANYNALLRTQIDNYLLSQCPADAVSTLTQSFSVFDALQFHGGKDNVEKKLISTLESRKSIQAEAMQPTKALQASFLSQEMSRHLYEQGLAVTEDARKARLSLLLRRSDNDELKVAKQKFFGLNQADGMRIVAHIYILNTLIEQLDANEGKSVQDTPAHWRYTQENILAAYTDYLRRANLPELIPMYCSILEAPRRYEVLSWNLIHETEAKQRLVQLKLIKNAGVDVVRFVETQAAMLFDELSKTPERLAASNQFSILAPGSKASKQARGIQADFFGDDEGEIETRHEHMIRALEWLMLVHETWPKVFSIGTRVYTHFLKHMNLNAARQLMQRVPFDAIVRELIEEDDSEPDIGSLQFWALHLGQSNITDVSAVEALSDARNFRELESLVKALDNLETIASLVVISPEMPAKNKDFWDKTAEETRAVKENMQPLLSGWLLAGIADGDKDLKTLRDKFLPETILAFISALHFAGTNLSRDNLLECMELSATIAERGSDLADAFVEAKRMKELVEAFAACSRALAVSGADKRGVAPGSSKKVKDMGWSRDLWSITTSQ
ncbi:hypothetical protein VHEMI08934 [[Torrubiella] hemipterigena]|uniref:Nuclear pore complex protein n=1 Tax=[Torrubiella] hemipterigena TaxID=1531966 RepID=A0A0A1T8B6_9HYPO|nr:hypothetical protein VHEMI08934 [[Torrubiella] hemipterigena]